MRSALRHSLALGAALAIWTGCGSGGTEPERFDPHGSLSFTYQGGRSGTYDASGDLALLPSTLMAFVGGSGGTALPAARPGAGAVRQGATLLIVAYRPTVAPRGDLFVLFAGDVTGTGELAINPLVCASSSSSSIGACRGGALFPDLDPTTLGDGTSAPADLAGKLFTLGTGTITITSLTDLRVRGTFEGVALRAAAGTGLPFETMTITRGAFDVPVRAQ